MITGGGTGIGAAVARRIRLEGGNVALVGRRPELALGRPSRRTFCGTVDSRG
ncbi:hypothetical protein [Rhizobium laguerreae]|uniref:hypothetical protein n=1 Tax=Rhizobium laguerreae TaxID=1076926 RepID=UPI002484A224